MVQRKLTIYLPGSAEALHNALRMLLQYGLISEKKAHTIEVGATAKSKTKQSRWGNAADRLRTENCLKGRSKEVGKLFGEFREDFEL
ncbi:MAG: hypothetical protein NT166_19845 [Candidatus Aminicenantes bacterium]|nr:hypothetical protein [Candidatus Aminicenantes bacterium]